MLDARPARYQTHFGLPDVRVVVTLCIAGGVIQFSTKPITTISIRAMIHERSGRFNLTDFTANSPRSGTSQAQRVLRAGDR